MTTEFFRTMRAETAAVRPARGEFSRRATRSNERRSGISPTFVRLFFFVGYYALHVLFVSEAFTIAITLPIFLICCFNVARIGDDRATVQDMIWLCIYMFLVISTCQSLFNGYFESEGLMEGVRFETADILKATLIVVVFLLVATATSIWVGNVGVKTLTSYELRDSSFVVLLLGNIASFALFIMSVGGLANALADRLSKEEFYAPVATGFLAAQLVTCFLGAAYVRKRPFRFWTAAGFALMVFLQLVSQNPFNTARFFLLIAWLPIILIYLKGRFSVTFFYMSALFGLIVMMPLLNFTGRHGESVQMALENVELPKFLFKIPYIDLLNLMVYAVQELEHIPYYYGAKTLSLLLFLVPRDIWPGKEILLGIELGNQLVDAGLAGTENLSMFFAADFYADLGMAGVILGAFVVSLLLTLYGQNRVVLIDGLDLPGFVLMACVPILIRGPIGAVIALPFLVLVALWIARVVLCSPVATDAHTGQSGVAASESWP